MFSELAAQDNGGKLQPQLWLLCQKPSMAIALLTRRPEASAALVTGVPELAEFSDGQAAASTLKDEFSTLQSDMQSLRDQSADLPTTSEAAFAAAFQPILQKFQTDLTGFGQELSKFTGDKLDAAFSKAPECANLSASSSP